MAEMIITNLRLPRKEYENLREAAHEAGVSINSYVRDRVKGIAYSYATKKDPIWDLPKLSKHKRKPLGLSSEDTTIYG